MLANKRACAYLSIYIHVKVCLIDSAAEMLP